MPIRVSCTHCRAAFNLADDMLGKKVRCRDCSEIFTVTQLRKGERREDDDDAPRRRITTESRRPKPATRPSRRDRDAEDDNDRSARPAAASNGTLLVVLACVGGGVLLLGLAGLLIVALKPKGPAPAVAKGPPPVIAQPNPNPVNPNPNPINPNPINPNPRPRPNPNPNPVNPPPKKPPPQPVAWQGAVDPPAQPSKEPGNPMQTIAAPNSAKLLFTHRASPYVSVGSNHSARDVREIWNLETMQKIGTIPGQLTLSEPTHLSPDGKYLASRKSGAGTTVQVFATANGQQVQTIEVAPTFLPMPLVEFAGPDQLVTVTTNVLDKQIQVWDLKTGAAVRQIKLPAAPFEARAYAVSPAGRYLACVDQGKLSIYDLSTGASAGESVAPRKPGALGGSAPTLAFSPDGLELAALFDHPAPQVVVWDLAKGAVVKNHELARNLRQLVPPSTTYQHNSLEWLPDRSGWLLYGFFLVDAVSGAPVWTVPATLESGFTAGPRRLLSTKHLAMATGKGKDRQVQIVSLPRNLIDAGVKTARAGENPLTGNKPPGTTADLSNARQLPPANGTVPWKVEPDGLPARKLVKQPIPLDGAENPHVFFAGKAAQAAVVSSVASTDRVRGRQLHVNRYDLTNGQSLGGMDLFSVVRQGNGELAGGLDPDGTCLVLVEPQERKRVDLWSLAAGKHVVGFTPYAGDGKVRLGGPPGRQATSDA